MQKVFEVNFAVTVRVTAGSKDDVCAGKQSLLIYV